MQRITAWFPVVLLAAVAAMTVWLDGHVQPPERSRDGKSRHDPDYVVENLAATRFGPDKLAVEAVQIMEQHKVNQLLVVDGERRLIGALNMHDLFRAKVI